MNKNRKLELLERKKYLEREISELSVTQESFKILANAGYGALGNQYFRYFDVKNAEAITLTGKVIIQLLEKGVNKFLSLSLKDNKDRCILSDTDSIGINLEDISNLFKTQCGEDFSSLEERINFLDFFSKEKILPKINSILKDIEKRFNGNEGILGMKRENICSSIIITGKKHYIMNVYDKEGIRYSEPKKKIMGIECVKSSTPQLMRNLIKETIDYFFTHSNNDLIKIINDCENKIYSEKDFSKIAFPKTVNGLKKYSSSTQTNNFLYEPKTPLHVRGSLRFNKWLKDNRLETKYSPIQEGEKIKYVYLKLPNIIKEDVIAWSSSDPPKELKLETMIDFERHFQIGYMNPIKTLLTAVGWKEKETISMSDLF